MNQRKLTLVDKDVKFRRYYHRYLHPLELHFESLRKMAIKDLSKRIIAGVAAWIVALGGIAYSLWPLWDYSLVLIVCGFMSAVGIGVWAWLPAGAFRLRLKDQVIVRIVPFFGDLTYRPEARFDPSRFTDWLILPRFSKVYSEDQIEGQYQGVPINLAEVRLEYQYSSSSREGTSTRIPFKGLMIELELTERYPGVILIRSEGDDMNGDFRINPSLSLVKTESGFEIYASNDANTNDFLKSWTLDRLKKVAERFKARQLFVSCHDNRLVMMIDHPGDYFELSHNRVVNFARDAELIKEQLDNIFSIVSLLQLEGSVIEKHKITEIPENLDFPDVSGTNVDADYNIGGWGCLIVFVAFAAAMILFLLLLEPSMEKGLLMWWSALGGLLLTAGIGTGLNGLNDRSTGTIFFAVCLLAGAAVIFYYYAPEETRNHLQAMFGRK